MKTKFEDRQVRLFISSTFRGMGNEREVLVRHVFPEIRRRCFERGVDFVEVDLRWGITEDQVNRGNAVPLCFQQIDKCYPYFLGLLDEYYGSTIPPEQRKIACAGYPWIEYHLDRSITELEILYALFYSDPKRSVKRQAVAEKALFYFRDPHYADRLPEKERQDYIESSPVNRAKQQNLKQRLRDHGCHITEYQQPIDLKALVLEQLWERIDRDFPDTITREQREDFEHDAFAFSRQSVYIKRQADFDRLSQHATSDEPPLIIVGDSGGGKSALLANWANEYRQAHPDELVFWHFCGSSPGSSDPIALLRRIMATLKSNFQIEDDLPTTLETVKEQFGQWLAKVPRRVILIIDGLNQLENTHATRGWLPHFIPAKIRLFISTLSTNEDQLPPKSAGWQRLHLPLLTDKSARQALITEYFKSYGKTLASREMQGLLDAPQTANPLYLMVI
ncbi:MAG: NACHT domain-containing protein, partial [Pseudomonadota bacterium]